MDADVMTMPSTYMEPLIEPWSSRIRIGFEVVILQKGRIEGVRGSSKEQGTLSPIASMVWKLFV